MSSFFTLMINRKRVVICDVHEPIEICHENANYFISIEAKEKRVPFDLDTRVAENWTRFSQARENARDNTVAYVQSYHASGNSRSALVHLAPFRYNQHFNRDDTAMQDTEHCTRLGFDPLSSYILLVAEGGKYLLFGRKIDYGPEVISAFGGFITERDISSDSADKIDVEKYLNRVLQTELGNSLHERLEQKYSIGIHFLPSVGPRGFDGIYYACLDNSVAQAQELMTANAQFSKELFAVEATPTGILDFIRREAYHLHSYDFGGIFTYLAVQYGEEEMKKIYRTCLEENLCSVSFANPKLNGTVRERVSAWTKGEVE